MIRSPWSTLSCLTWMLLFGAYGCQPATEPGSGIETVAVGPEALTAGSATTSDGVEIAYSTKGSGNPALVFVHGWSCDRSYWSEQLDDFSQDHRVVALDLAGHGDSGRRPGRARLEDFGADIEAVVTALDLPSVILIGHSMGGPAVLAGARRLPERTAGVILVDSLHDPDLKFKGDSWSGLMAAYRQDFLGTCQQFVQSMFLADADPTLVKRIVDGMCAAPPEVAVPLLEAFVDYDAPAALQAVHVPVRSINAASFPTQVDTLKGYVGDFDVAIQEGVGHFLMLVQPTEFNRLLRIWVDQLSASSPGSSQNPP